MCDLSVPIAVAACLLILTWAEDVLIMYICCAACQVHHMR